MNGAKEDPLKAVLDLTNGQGADVVVDMAGSADSVNLCTAAVKHNGIMVFYCWITQEITVNISRWHNNSMEVINTGLVHHGITRRTLWTPMACAGYAGPSRHRATDHPPVLDLAEAFAVAANDPTAIKVVIEP